MAKKYAYYLAGRNIAILNEDSNGEYVSPDDTISNGIKMEYTSRPTAVDEESDSIDINEILALALVDYVKAKFAENEGDYKKKEYHLSEFKKKVYQYQNKIYGGSRLVMTTNPFAIR